MPNPTPARRAAWTVGDQMVLDAFSDEARALVDRYVEQECAARLRLAEAQSEKERRALAKRNAELEAECIALHKALLRTYAVFEDRAREIIRNLPLLRSQNRTRGQMNRMVASPLSEQQP